MAKNELAPLRNSIVRVQVGRRTFDAKFVPTCHTCMHPARMEIEMRLVNACTFTSIAAEFSEVEWTKGDGSVQVLPRLTPESVRNHFRAGHMPLTTATVREIVEERSRQLGAAYQDGLTLAVDQVTAAKVILQQGFERIVSGEEAVGVRDTLAAAKLIQDIEDRAGEQATSEAWSEAMMIYFQTAQELMPPQMWASFAERLQTNPILHALSERLAADGRVVDSD